MNRGVGKSGVLPLFISAIGVFIFSVLIISLATGCGDPGRSQRSPTQYVGGAACYSCHPAETALWSGSHHDMAMQVPSDSTVLGDFNNTRFSYAGITSEFYKREGLFYVRTDGPDGTLQEFQISYTFGATPLQQYLIRFPDGRYQTLGIAWDVRPVEEGGQRWFHLYPDERVTFDDPLHWTGPNQNWNYMCADCHSTNLDKNFDVESNGFATTWTDIDVSCEACHGAGSEHVKWAEARPEGIPVDDSDSMGLTVRLRDFDQGLWILNRAEITAKRNPERASNTLVETCARCHARRGIFREDYEPGQPLMDAYRPALLEQGLYHADGQILDEVFVYGSFIQSKMYRAGVTCSNCHDAHSLNVRAPGNELCKGCHLSTKYDTPEHHFHKPDSTGALCVDCHMPAQTYMVVDPRRDHSLRNPRPDLTEIIGSPNACNQCHKDKTVAWAVRYVEEWYGPESTDTPHYGEILNDGRTGVPEAASMLVELARDYDQSGIVRASAISVLGAYSDRSTLQAVETGIADEDPLVRLSALRVLDIAEPDTRLRLVLPLLDDSLLAVRIEAARLLSTIPAQRLTSDEGVRIDEGIEEYVASELVNSDRPESHLNIGVLHVGRGAFSDAEESFQTALRLNPSSVRARINLADLYRLLGRESDGEALLHEAIVLDSTAADAHHALGLLLARQQRLDEAVTALGLAADARPDVARFSYVYGIALHSTGKIAEALSVLTSAFEQHPSNRDLLMALITINRDENRFEDALRYTRILTSMYPDDATAGQLLEQLENQ